MQYAYNDKLSITRSWGQSLARNIRRAWRATNERRLRRQLAHLDDRLLRDVGLIRDMHGVRRMPDPWTETRARPLPSAPESSTNLRMFGAPALLVAALIGADVSAATLMTLPGSIIAEQYAPEPSPFAAPAASVLLSVLFDETVPKDNGTVNGDVVGAQYRNAVLSTTLDVFDGGGALLGSYAAPTASIWIGDHTGNGTDQLELTSDPGPLEPEEPFTRLFVSILGDDLFDGVGLTQLAMGQLAAADPFAQGTLTIRPFGDGALGVAFDFDIDQIAFKRDVDVPMPVPAPPAVIALLLGLCALGALKRTRA